MLVLCKIVNHWIMSMSHGRGEIKRNCYTRMLYNTNTVLQNCVLKNKKVRRSAMALSTDCTLYTVERCM